MQKTTSIKECHICGYIGDFEEITTEQGEYFTNCNRCGFFEQKMIKNVISDIDKVKNNFPIHTEEENFITVKKGGYGTWKVIQTSVTNEGSFVNNDHINEFLKNIDEMLIIQDVKEISYHIKTENGWENIIRQKNLL